MAIEVAHIVLRRSVVARLQRKAKALNQAMRDIKHQLPALGVIEFMRQRNGEISAHRAVVPSLRRFCSRPKRLWVIGPCR
ncbi:hypothetical protein Xant_21625 [Xanthomonas cissicola]|uniref:Transposase n=1 Tax=Xanthomonas cissicola TaxID=86186 RepID=A0ABX3M115_9XANT|nr:hypothetical protein Xant_21625 [Xanthomonas cissicola]